MNRDASGCWTGSGAADAVRENDALAARNVLLSGISPTCVTADHSGETCTKLIIKMANNESKKRHSDIHRDLANKAIDKLEFGFGYGKASADHTGQNTCLAVLAAATS